MGIILSVFSTALWFCEILWLVWKLPQCKVEIGHGDFALWRCAHGKDLLPTGLPVLLIYFFLHFLFNQTIKTHKKNRRIVLFDPLSLQILLW